MHKKLIPAIFLVSISVLMLEISLTRICSVTIWYHFAFMVISIVLFGFGASGAYLAVRDKWRSADEHHYLGRSSLYFSIAIIASFLIIRRIPLDPFKLTQDSNQFFYLLLYYIFLSIPFFFAGITLGVAFSRWTDQIGLLYFSDLLGAGAGCLLVALTMEKLSASASVFVASAFAFIASFILLPKVDFFRKAFSLILIPFSLIMALFFKNLVEVYPCPSKGLGMIQSLERGPFKPEIIFTKWNMISRIDVSRTADPPINIDFVGLSPLYRKGLPAQLAITLDGDAGTLMNKFEGDFEKFSFLDHSLYSAAYLLKSSPQVLIIGTGGGVDVLTALKNNAISITGVELNKIIIEITKDLYADFIGRIYDRPEVTIINAEGRSFIRKDKEKYDIIQLSGVDTWSGLASGAYTLSENYLYTTEAFMDFINHLKEDGVLSFIRYVFTPPREVLRLASLAIEAFKRLGLGHPQEHIAIIADETYASFLLKRSPLLPEEINRISEFAQQNRFRILYLPGTNQKNPFYSLLKSNNPEAFYHDYLYDVRPVFDDNPFFYKYYKWSKLSPSPQGKGGQIGANIPISEMIIIVLLLQSLILCLLFIFLPLWLKKRNGLLIAGRFNWIIYFLGLGIGFIFIEIAIMQKLILFLEHPSYSITVVLSSLLVFSGIGSFISYKAANFSKKLLIGAMVFLFVILLFYLLSLNSILNYFLGVSFPWKVVISILLLLPIGVSLGIPFPTGLYRLSRKASSFVPWAWGVNGCASVVGSILSMPLAMAYGFSFTMLLAGIIYLISLIFILLIWTDNEQATFPEKNS